MHGKTNGLEYEIMNEKYVIKLNFLTPQDYYKISLYIRKFNVFIVLLKPQKIMGSRLFIIDTFVYPCT